MSKIAFITLTSLILSTCANATPNDSLFKSITQHSLSGVRSALDKGASANARDSSDHTAFMAAVMANDVEIAKYLLKRGANPKLQTKSGDAVGDLASNYEVIRFLNGIGIKTVESAETALTSAFLDAARRQGPLQMTQLLTDGANVNSTDLSGDTALIIASRDDKADNVDFILAHGANVNTANDKGETALLISAEQGELAIVKSLASHGADVKAVVGDGLSVWYIAKDKATRELLDQLGAPHEATEDEMERYEQEEQDHRFKTDDLTAFGLTYRPPKRDDDADGSTSDFSYIQGTVFNSSATKSFKYVEVKIVEYDSSGTVLGTEIANTEYLGPHEQWDFKIPVTYTDVARYKIIGLRSDP